MLENIPEQRGDGKDEIDKRLAKHMQSTYMLNKIIPSNIHISS